MNSNVRFQFRLFLYGWKSQENSHPFSLLGVYTGCFSCFSRVIPFPERGPETLIFMLPCYASHSNPMVKSQPTSVAMIIFGSRPGIPMAFSNMALVCML